MIQPVNIFWFRRDLRLEDNTGFFEALKGDLPILPIFIFDKDILDELPKEDARVTFIFSTVQNIRAKLKEKHSSGIALFHDRPIEVFKQLLDNFIIQNVYTNHDYEPYAIQRDLEIKSFLASKSIAFHSYKDQVIFEKDEIVKSNGEPYVVYTPYMKAWKAKFKAIGLQSYNTKNLLNNLIKDKNLTDLSLSDIGFKPSNQHILEYRLSPTLIEDYEAYRNFPAKDATSRLGPYLRFGTVSIRNVVNKAIAENNEVFWQQLIWREFFMQILWHFPHTKDQSFKPKYDRLEWRNNEDEFKAWCEGKTGYPLVDAGMRQLNETGFMHNRVRMLVGSFLCKHLLIDWRWGEAYFAEKLHDYEMASNVGNWQWVAGCGVDAAPYFRIFNPTTQIEKFDKQQEYIKTWVPEYQELTYPQPIVEHSFARERCLKVYKLALD